MLIPIKFGIGAPIGNGKQYLAWIHIDDLCGIYLKAIEDEKMTGVYNAAAPDHKTNQEFMEALARILHKPFWFPNVPAIVMSILLGELGDAALKGSRISSEKVRNAGYDYRFPSLESALQDLLAKNK